MALANASTVKNRSPRSFEIDFEISSTIGVGRSESRSRDSVSSCLKSMLGNSPSNSRYSVAPHENKSSSGFASRE